MIQQHIITRFKAVLLVLSCFMMTSVVAQTISGPSPVQENTTATYSFNNGLTVLAPKWNIVGGTASATSSIGTTYTVEIQWGSAGFGSITFMNKTSVLGSTTISITEPAQPGFMPINSVRTTVARAATTDIRSLNNNEKIESVGYLDGLGRPIQQVAIRAGGNSEDIVTHVDYDEFGRQVKEYLPYSTYSNNGDYRSTAKEDTHNFYSLNRYRDDFPNATSAEEINPYSEKAFDNSPLNRVEFQAAPGEAWKMGNDHEIKMAYEYNTSEDNVVFFKVNFLNNQTDDPELVVDGVYPANKLYKTITKDENWMPNQQYPKEHTVEEYKNLQGQVVLKRSFNQKTWHDTYYVYDDFGNLTYVLPPKMATYIDFFQTDAASNSVSINTSANGGLYQSAVIAPHGGFGDISFNSTSRTIQFSAQAYMYNYGGQTNTMNVQFKQGKVMDFSHGPNLNGLMLTGTLTIYNTGSATITRSVAAIIQNGELHISPDFGTVIGTSYSFNLSASLIGRDISIPDFTSTDLEALAYQYKYDSRNRLVEKKIPGKGWEHIVYDRLDRPIMTQDSLLRDNGNWLFTKYDVYGRVAYTGIYTNGGSRLHHQNTSDSYTTDNASRLYEDRLSSNIIDGINVGYTNKGYPNSSFLELHMMNYYDDYSFGVPSELAFSNYYSQTQANSVRGLSTVSKTRVLDTNDWISTVTYYDYKLRPIFVGIKNEFLNSEEINHSAFDFSGSVVESRQEHTKAGQTLVIENTYTYDHLGRLLTQTQELNGSGQQELIVNNHYDELGQLESKNVGGTASANPINSQGLQTVDYSYNIRGWLKSINDPGSLIGTSDLFGFGINYDTPGGPSTSSTYNEPLYNGNISHVFWKTDNTDSELRHYSYKYDALNRFTNAYYGENNKFTNKYQSYITGYDRNGNIDRLVRRSVHPTNSNSSTTIDNLTYTYDSGNMLMSVKDSGGLNGSYVEGFRDGNPNGDDFSYDANGNMELDANKDLTIEYNHLNLPVKVSKNEGGGGYMEYTYDATGTKQSKTLYMPDNLFVPSVTQYDGNFIYERTGPVPYRLKMFSTPEGYVEPNGSDFDYVYQYKDHLGNVRLSYKDTNGDGEVTGATTEIFYDDFESATGWDGTGASWGHPITEFDDSFQFDGEVSGRLYATTSAVAVHSLTWVEIDNDSPTEYIYSGWAYSTNPTIRLGLAMKEDGETGYLTIFDDVRDPNTRNKWVYIEKRVVIPPNITSINLRIEAQESGWGYGNVWWDNVSIRRVNDPMDIEIVEENNYYPFGLKHKGYNPNINGTANPYQTYNGKELEEALGVDWYEMDWRGYDPAIGRFSGIDLMSESYYSLTPYHFSRNNPVSYSDPTGLYAEAFASTVVDEDGEVIDYKADGDPNIYLNDRNGVVIGQEEEGREYEIGEKIFDVDNSDPNYSLYSLITNTGASTVSAGISTVAVLKTPKEVLVYDESGNVIGRWITRLKVPFRALKLVNGVLQAVGPVSDVLNLGISSIDFYNGDMSPLRYGFNLTGTGASLYASYLALGGASVAASAGVIVGGTVYVGDLMIQAAEESSKQRKSATESSRFKVEANSLQDIWNGMKQFMNVGSFRSGFSIGN